MDPSLAQLGLVGEATLDEAIGDRPLCRQVDRPSLGRCFDDLRRDRMPSAATTRAGPVARKGLAVTGRIAPVTRRDGLAFLGGFFLTAELHRRSTIVAAG